MLLKRNTRRELMDDFSINDARIDSALMELKKINMYLGGFSASKAGFHDLLKSKTGDSDLNILDAGSGSSEILVNLKKKLNEINIFSFDKSRRVCFYAKSSSSLNVVCGDIFYLPFKKDYFDAAHASLFLHHFSSVEIKDILMDLMLLVKKGIIINELRRNIFALAGIKILTIFFSKSKLVKNDAPLSVKKGFLKKELEDILKLVPSAGFSIKRKWAFRWLVVVFK